MRRSEGRGLRRVALQAALSTKAVLQPERDVQAHPWYPERAKDNCVRQGHDPSLQCSFCHKPQSAASKLISSPSDYARAYICDECVAVCTAIIEDEKREQEAPQTSAEQFEEPHPLLGHPLASSFLASVERWIRIESLGDDAADAFAEMRNIAIRMVRDAT